MEPDLIQQGLSLLIYGMGTVFVFLTLMVFATTLMSKIVRSLNPEEPVAEPSAAKSDTTSHAIKPAHLEAIKQAIALYRNK
ncbi:MAG: OadG family protein [Pseudomonadota bacterium]